MSQAQETSEFFRSILDPNDQTTTAAADDFAAPPQPTPPAGTLAPAAPPVPFGPDLVSSMWRPPDAPPARRTWWRRGPSRKELAEQARQQDLAALAAPFAVEKRVCVANTAGRAGKTTASILLACGFGNWTGRGVVLVENGPTGSLRDRLETVPPPAEIHTIDDLADALEDLKTRTDAGKIIQTYFTVWQNQGRFSVLIGRQKSTHDDGTGRLVAKEPTLSQDETQAIAGLLGQVYPITVFDNGNNDIDDAQLGAMSISDVVVLPITWGGIEINGALRVLQTLNDLGMGRLAHSAIVVVTQPPGKTINEKNRQNATAWFRQYGIQMVEIPPDPAMAERDKPLFWHSLAPATHQAVLELCATIAYRFRTLDPVKGWDRPALGRDR